MNEKIKLLTDSCCDIPAEIAGEYGIEILSFPITVEGKEYRERIDFSAEEFYEMLTNAAQVPTHAQLIPIEFEDLYEAAYRDGYTDVIYVSINAKGSSTFDNSNVAVNNFYEAHPEAKDTIRFHLINSGCYTMGYGMAVIEAAKKIRRGLTAKEIVGSIRDWVENVRILFVPLTLDFAKKSGRISAAAGFVGELLGLKPIITFQDGDSVILEKVRGEKSVIPRLMQMVAADKIPGTPYSIVHGMQPQLTNELIAEAEKKFGRAEYVYPLGPVVAINAGPNVVGIIYKAHHE
ncbi:MAG: DegV family protein [Clostridiales bacterium]|nr:MAG: DegV family protein [Clostridiales bacterium]